MSSGTPADCFAPIAIALDQIVIDGEFVLKGIDLDTGRQTVVSLGHPPLALSELQCLTASQLAAEGLVLMISIHQVRAQR